MCMLNFGEVCLHKYDVHSSIDRSLTAGIVDSGIIDVLRGELSGLGCRHSFTMFQAF